MSYSAAITARRDIDPTSLQWLSLQTLSRHIRVCWGLPGTGTILNSGAGLGWTSKKGYFWFVLDTI